MEVLAFVAGSVSMDNSAQFSRATIDIWDQKKVSLYKKIQTYKDTVPQ